MIKGRYIKLVGLYRDYKSMRSLTEVLCYDVNSEVGFKDSRVCKLILKTAVKLNATNMGGGRRRVVGNTWCVGAGEPSSRPVRVANSASP